MSTASAAGDGLLSIASSLFTVGLLVPACRLHHQLWGGCCSHNLGHVSDSTQTAIRGFVAVRPAVLQVSMCYTDRVKAAGSTVGRRNTTHTSNNHRPHGILFKTYLGILHVLVGGLCISPQR